MTKYTLRFLNVDNAFWVDILRCKYCELHPQNNKIPPKWSQFFGFLCKNLDHIKTNLCINAIDLDSTSILKDPQCLEITICFRPTFVNMNYMDLNVHLADIIENGNWNFNCLNEFLSNNLNSPVKTLGQINPEGAKHWVWLPSSNNISMVYTVYASVNSSKDTTNLWEGWKNLWKLTTSP